jgi:predicted GNAT family acetyltransferase
MNIQQHDNGLKGSFFIEQLGKKLAQMTYTWAGKDRFIIDHTEVDDALRGMSAGKQMVTKAVEFAREKGVKIIPLCPFAKSVFDKVEAFRDVL